MSDIPILIHNDMLHRGCQFSIAQKVQNTLSEQSQDAQLVFWLRMQGRSYRDIGGVMGCSHAKPFRIVHNVLRQSVYSILERATCIA